MGLRMDLGDSSISINEDHKQTENTSLFKLSFIWSGLGLEEPLELTLFRRSERFVVQLARLVEQVEQRDFHNEEIAGPAEVQYEAETGGNPKINSGDLENDDPGPASLENNIPESEKRAPISSDETPGDPPRGTHENESAQVHGAAQPEGLDEQRQGVDGDDQAETTHEAEADRHLEETAHDSPPNNQDPATRLTNVDDQGTEAQGPSPNTQGDDDNTASNGESPSTPKPREDEYDEYEAEGVDDSTPAQTSIRNGESSVGWDNHEYDYEEDYDGVDEGHSKHMPPDNTLYGPTNSDRAPPAPSTPKLQGHESLQNANLKRNLDELEYEEYETPSAPSSPASDHKRVKHT
ncbi:hypothetical protein FRC11_010263 [Ceratobasidium sp. 423]|nr:hypothetical protein FRC11_010263 [Ceratobasidium sp. 423]